MPGPQKNVLFVQAGDYAEAWERLNQGEPEVYRDQRASIDWVGALSQDHDVTVLALRQGAPGEARISPSLRCLNADYATADLSWLTALFDEVRPDRIICRVPHHLVLRLARQRRIATLATFADFFANKNLRQLYRNLRLRRELTGAHLPCVSNHNLNASKSVARALFYPTSRIVPWDHHIIDAGYAARAGRAEAGKLRVFYAGGLSADKGLGDALEAVAMLNAQGLQAQLTVAGAGDPAPWAVQAEALGAAEAVTFLGKIPNATVLAQMNAHDAVLVPSRWEYPEGLPNILYEALAARTPLVMSDHPAFAGRLVADRDCLVFPAARPDGLAQALQRLAEDDALFRALSENAAAALDRLTFGLFWDELWQKFLDDPTGQSGWVRENALKALKDR